LLARINREVDAYCTYKDVKSLADIKVRQFASFKRELKSWGK